MRPAVAGILATLLARHRASGHVHLNDLGEAVGVTAITPEEIEAIVDALEAAGLRVGEDLNGQDVTVMRAVVASARRLAASLGRRPSVDEIAVDAGEPAHVVRRALEHAAGAGKTRRLPD